MKILAIESSCDETAAAVIQDGTKIITNVIASSTLMHEKYGGIVPEVAAREQLRYILPVITESLLPYGPDINDAIKNNIDAVAITVGPGLIGSLLIGVETAKTISFVSGVPIIPVNHVLAHMYANFLDSEPKSSSRVISRDNQIKFPAISLVVSGGHTELFLMESEKKLTWLGGTLDDAAGEAFDKTARLLGFGSRGGLAIQETAAKNKNKKSVTLPRPMIHDDSLNFSFSGLKTAIMREVNKLKANNQFERQTIAQLCHEVQEAITDVLVFKTLAAAHLYHAKSILLSGGVASNLKLREKMSESALKNKLKFFVPEVKFCTDNAAYIGAYAYFRGKQTSWEKINALPDLSVEDTAII